MDAQKEYLYTKDDVERIAYNIYCWREKMGKPGDKIADWLEAEDRCKKWWGGKEVNT